MSASGGDALVAAGAPKPGSDGRRRSPNASLTNSHASPTRRSDACISASGGDDEASVWSAAASVTSRSTRVMIAASSSWRCRAQFRVSDAVFSKASGRDIPEVASASRETANGRGETVAPASRRTVSITARSLASELSLEERQRVARRQQELHA
jgi:hypothetical protein